MKRSKRGLEGKEVEEKIDVGPPLPLDPKAFAHGAEPVKKKETPSPAGPEMEIGEGLINLSKHPRNEGYF